MAPTPGYIADPSGSLVIIRDETGVEQYRHEVKYLYGAGGTRDFNLVGGSLQIGVNDDRGRLNIEIRDDLKALFDTTSSELPCLIKNYWDIELWLGKTSGTVQRWFYGKIKDVEGDPQSSVSGSEIISINLICEGWLIRGADRISSMKKYQGKLANGLDLDPADITTRLDNLTTSLWQDTDHLPVRGLGAESGITVSPDVSDITVADLQENFQTFLHIQSRIAGIEGGFFYFDGDRILHTHKTLGRDSGFLFTDDEDSDLAQNWDPDRIAYIDTSTFKWRDSIGTSGYSILHAPGTVLGEQDLNQDPTVDAVFDLSANFVAIEFTPNKSTLSRIGIKLQKKGDPANIGDAFIKIVPIVSGEPKEEDSLKRVRIPVESLVALSASTGTWLDIPFEKIILDSDRSYAVVLEKYGDGTDSIEWEYLTSIGGGTLNYWTSGNGITWTPATGDFTLRTYPQRTINKIVINSKALRTPIGIREKILPIRDFPEEDTVNKLLFGLSTMLSKTRRVLEPFNVTMPADRIQPGQWCVIKLKNGLQIKVDIIAVSLSFSALDASACGISNIQVQVQTYI